MNRLLLLAACIGLSLPALAQTDSLRADTLRLPPPPAPTSHLRPSLHFSPRTDWINDPNGLVYHRGEYHLFFQHNPLGNKWGHMSWGHAVSKDLLRWQQLSIAIPEDSAYIYSGCVIPDPQNRSGLFTGPNGLVAIYTADYHGQGEEQHLAYSADDGRTWTKYEANPVLAMPGEKNFRDPNIIFHPATDQWVMSVALPEQRKVQFYGSKTLKEWQLLSEFGGYGDRRKIWECPALMEVPIEGQPGQNKWVLLLSGGGPFADDYTGMQYFIGDFDGNDFTLGADTATHYLDYGKDFYAAIPYHYTPEGRKVIVGWMANWKYAADMPTSPWRGQMSLPRELMVRQTPQGLRLVQRPVQELFKRSRQTGQFRDLALSPSLKFENNATLESGTYWIETELDVPPGGYVEFGLFEGGGKSARLRYDAVTETLSFDRTNAGIDFDASFRSVEKVKVPMLEGRVRLLIVVDKLSVEVFASDGRYTLSSLVFPKEYQRGFSVSGNGTLRNTRIGTF